MIRRDLPKHSDQRKDVRTKTASDSILNIEDTSAKNKGG